MDNVVQSRKNIQAFTLECDKRATISFIIAFIHLLHLFIIHLLFIY